MASIGKNLIEELKWTADDLQAQLDDLKAKIAALEGLDIVVAALLGHRHGVEADGLLQRLVGVVGAHAG